MDSMMLLFEIITSRRWSNQIFYCFQARCLQRKENFPIVGPQVKRDCDQDVPIKYCQHRL